MEGYLPTYMDNYKINLRELEEAYGPFATRLDIDILDSDALRKAFAKILSPMTKSVIPLRPPRILVLGPGRYIRNAVATELKTLLGLPLIALDEVVQNEIEAKTPLGRALLQRVTDIPDDVSVSLVERELRRSHVRHLGWVLEGLPRSKTQVSKFAGLNLAPTLIVTLKAKPEEFMERLKKVMVDPATGKIIDLGLNARVEAETSIRLRPRQSRDDLLLQEVTAGLAEQDEVGRAARELFPTAVVEIDFSAGEKEAAMRISKLLDDSSIFY
eukprot:TRINITY_DN13241_c0_g1_i3.p1 TRINITY_DN13241_c0_g1~~TRINITY_DN13241_c0_g1_i3.p1  ORF type:complete len:271 (+),score=76.84 TRINITY_DN13241_c0_g1_i3:588-1400(+)